MAANNTDDVRAVMVETARVQLAALSAGIEFWSGWVEAAGKFVQVASKELGSLAESNANADRVVSSVTDASREYLASVAELPGKAVTRYNRDLGASGVQSGPRRRAAAAKR